VGVGEVPEVKPPLFSFRIEFSIKCPHCDRHVPLDGPLEKVVCGNCRSDIDVPRDYWVDTLKGSCLKMQDMEMGGGRGSILMGTFWGDLTLARFDPYCDSCKTEFEDPWHLEPGSSYKCRECGMVYPVEAPPVWLRKGVPGIRLLINALISSAGSAPEVQAELMTLSCPSCAASLDIDGGSRIIHCSYCDDDVYIPDTIWRKYHPGRRKRRWFVLSEFADEDQET
jgi:Zn finger protein HypA/HybF involved in hydrogenase expression